MKPVVVIPVFNHEHAVGRVVEQVRRFDVPVVLVDDGSQPTCAQVLETLAMMTVSMTSFPAFASAPASACLVSFFCANANEATTESAATMRSCTNVPFPR
jgi:hypothetical protein